MRIWFVLLSACASQLALPVADSPAVPAATCLRLPVGDPPGEGYYVAQGVGGARLHLGEDWNGVGGGNTDLGDPVFTMGPGTVVSAGEGGPGWGLVVRVVHVLPDGSRWESVYAHLQRMDVQVGQVLSDRAAIGTIGNAGGAYLAHLHLELRDRPGLPLGAGYGHGPHHLSPREAVARWPCKPAAGALSAGP